MIFVNDIIRIIAGGLGGTDRPQRPDGMIGHSEVATGNGVDTTDDVLFSIPIPAGLMNSPGCNLSLLAFGSSAANGNNKNVKAWIGPDAQTLGAAVVTTATTKIADSGVVTTNNGGWQVAAEVVKTGAYKANTQVAYGTVLTGVTTGASSSEKPVALTLDETKQQFFTVTGASGTTGAGNDLVGSIAQVFVTNGG